MIQPLRRALWRFLKKKLGLKPPYDQTVPLLCTHPEKSKTEKTHAPQCLSKHFIIARTWKPPRCPSTHEWIEKVWLPMYNGILLSYKKEYMGLSSNKVHEPGAYCTE